MTDTSPTPNSRTALPGNAAVISDVEVKIIETISDKFISLFKSDAPNIFIQKVDISSFSDVRSFFYNIAQRVESIDILINCTSLGFGKTIDVIPIQSNQIIKLNSNCIVFDIIYQPELTKLLKASQKIGLQILNGSAMNLEQAVLALSLIHI